jgi:hypothetical protein
LSITSPKIDVFFEDEVGRAREDVIRAQQEDAFVAFLFGPLQRGQNLLIRLRARIHDIGRAFVALELHRVPK